MMIITFSKVDLTESQSSIALSLYGTFLPDLIENCSG